jgi:CHAT domain-containing protein
VRGIAPLFKKSQTFLRSAATRKAFIDNAPTGRIVHVATHARADTIDPLRSRILFAPTPQPSDEPKLR